MNESVHSDLKFLCILPVSIVALVLVCAVFTSVEAKSSSSTQGIKWTTYTDPYNRYSIKYPSKWTIQSEPVHSQTSPLLEVPLKISNSHASTLMVSEIDNKVGLSLREFTSFVQNNDFTGVPKKVGSPVSCGFASQPNIEVCEYYQVYTYGLTEMGNKVMLFSGPNNEVFNVGFFFGPDEPLSSNDINHMVSSLRILNSESNVNGESSIPPVFHSNESSIPPVFESGNNKNYKSDSIGIQVDYPNNWSYTESKESLVYFVPNNESQPNSAPQFQKVYLLMGIDTTVNDKNIALENYLKYSKMQLQDRNVGFGQANKTTLAGEPGYNIVFTNQNGNRGEIFVVTHNGKPYLISYVAVPAKFDRYLPVINKIISSLKFT